MDRKDSTASLAGVISVTNARIFGGSEQIFHNRVKEEEFSVETIQAR